MTRIAFVVTVPVTANVLLRGQLAWLKARGHDVTVISSPGPELDEVAAREGVRTIGIPMQREIDPPADAVSLARLAAALRSLRPDIVNASTAKAGLLGMIAASIVRVPVRVYLLRGLRLETERGAKRRILGATERVAAACAHRVICVSESLRAAYVAAGYAAGGKCAVLGGGSSNGVDIARFARTPERERQARAVRGELGIAADAPVVGFIGRPVRDKGIAELLEAFAAVRATHPRARLVIVGAGFASDDLDPSIALGDTIVVPRVAEPAPYYAVMDVLAFPSHREGFPNAPLEAAAAGIPVVGSRATGVVDAIADGATGVVVDTGDARALGAALIRYLDDPELRRAHGAAGAARAAALFSRERVWEAWQREYERLTHEPPSNSGI